MRRCYGVIEPKIEEIAGGVQSPGVEVSDDAVPVPQEEKSARG